MSGVSGPELHFSRMDSKARNIIEGVEYPATYDDLDGWVSRYLGERLTLLSRAARAAKKSEFSRSTARTRCVAPVGGALPRNEARRGRQTHIRPSVHELGLELSLTGEASISRYPGDYVVKYGKERRELDLHLKRGASREPRNCLRIYFFWDDDGEQVVVGHLPRHLTTATT